MKKLIFGLLVTASLISCNNESAKREKIANDNIKFYGHVWDVAIVEGRVNGFFKENVLLEQDFAKDNKLSVAKVLDNAGLTVSAFVRFRVGA